MVSKNSKKEYKTYLLKIAGTIIAFLLTAGLSSGAWSVDRILKELDDKVGFKVFNAEKELVSSKLLSFEKQLIKQSGSLDKIMEDQKVLIEYSAKNGAKLDSYIEFRKKVDN